MKTYAMVILAISALANAGFADSNRDAALTQLEQAMQTYPELAASSITNAKRKTIEFRNGDHDDSSKIVVTVLDGKRAQISCVSHFAVGMDSPDVKKVQNNYPFSKEDLEGRSGKWFFGTTRILGENSELMRKISSYLSSNGPVTGEHQEMVLSLSPMYERCLKLEAALEGASNHLERMAFYHNADLPDYKVTSLDKDSDLSSDKKARRN